MQNPGKLIDEEGHQFHVSADTCTCKPVVKQILSEDHTPCQWRNVKTHTLISGIKSEDTYVYVPMPNLSHALAATLDLFLLGVIVYDWTFFLTAKTLGIDTEIVFLCSSVPRLLDTLYFGDYGYSF